MGAAGLKANGNCIALDTLNNVYTTGYFQGTVDFDPNAGTNNLTALNDDIFISKLDTSGNLAWAKNFGAGAYEWGMALTVDSFGKVYTTGFFQGIVDFDPNAGVYNLTALGGSDLFVHKMNQSAVGISENPYLNNNKIYPNPSNGQYTIELAAKAEVTICNVLGEIILTQTMEAGKQALNLQQQVNGIYFVRLVSEGKQEGFKLVKEE